MSAPASPLFCLPNRVWRVYRGGLLLDRFRGLPHAADGHLPEDWLASVTVARNGENQQSPCEGLSRLRRPDGSSGPFLRDILPAGEPGVLCKFLDAAIRLPLQCHPDRAWARKHLNSDNGKTESWMILGTRPDSDPPPSLLIGFRPGVDPGDFRAAVKAQDIDALVGMLHRFPAVPGDVWFIPGRLPHAIGAGVFLLEAQEPTDWVVQPERVLDGFSLSREAMYGPLAEDEALDCFAFAGAADAATIRDRCCLSPRIAARGDTFVHETIIGAEHTDCFRLDRLHCTGPAPLPSLAPVTVAIVLDGEGTLDDGRQHYPMGRGDTCCIPRTASTLQVNPQGKALTMALVSRTTRSADTPR